MQRSGSVQASKPFRVDSYGDQGCAAENCTNRAECAGYCSSHYTRLQRGGDLTQPLRRLIRPGETPVGYKSIDDKGYVLIRVLGANLGRGIAEHRLMWEARYDALLPGQNVHHKNGVRDDNRYENLEIWDTTQPAGQRPEDKVAHALEMLRRYAPEMLESA